MQSWPHGNLERFKAKAFLFNYMPFYVPERPAVARVNEYIRKRHNKEATDTTAAEALRGFVNFPKWMWRNSEFEQLVEWLHRYNQEV